MLSQPKRLRDGRSPTSALIYGAYHSRREVEAYYSLGIITNASRTESVRLQVLPTRAQPGVRSSQPARRGDARRSLAAPTLHLLYFGKLPHLLGAEAHQVL